MRSQQHQKQSKLQAEEQETKGIVTRCYRRGQNILDIPKKWITELMAPTYQAVY